MTVQFNTNYRNILRDTYSAGFPATATIQFRTGAPAGANGAAGGSLLGTLTLPATPYTNGTGQLTLNGTWSTTASATGTIGHYRLTGGSNVEEGTVTITAGGGDLEVDDVSIASIGQVINITTWTNTMPGA